MITVATRIEAKRHWWRNRHFTPFINWTTYVTVPILVVQTADVTHWTPESCELMWSKEKSFRKFKYSAITRWTSQSTWDAFSSQNRINVCVPFCTKVLCAAASLACWALYGRETIHWCVLEWSLLKQFGALSTVVFHLKYYTWQLIFAGHTTWHMTDVQYLHLFWPRTPQRSVEESGWFACSPMIMRAISTNFVRRRAREQVDAVRYSR
jgi:hypothetical protein